MKCTHPYEERAVNFVHHNLTMAESWKKTLVLYTAVKISIDLYIEDITWRREDMNFIFEW